MPIYEYRCETCGHELDALQKLRDDPLKDCPECTSGALRRLISAPSFRLKGDGWYETDFKSDKETKRNLVDGSTDAKSKDKAGKEAAADGKSSGDKKSADGSSKDSGSGSSSSSSSKSSSSSSVKSGPRKGGSDGTGSAVA